MPRAQQDIQQTYTFIKGLITESSALSSSTDSFSDGINVTVTTKGEAVKRRGVDYEAGNGLIELATFADRVAVSSGIWEGVAGDANLNLIIIQIGINLYFFDASLEAPSSALFARFDISGLCLDLQTAQSNRCQFTSINGGLIVTNPGCDPLHIEYYEDEAGVPKLDAYRIQLKIRDFTGLDDGLSINEEPTTLTAAHHYNLKNQGWINGREDVTDFTDNGASSGNISDRSEDTEPLGDTNL